MTRELKTSPSALLALARTRRMQRAMAHAYLHRNEPMPTLRGTLGFVTDTARVADEVGGRGHTMRVAGVSVAERVAYVVEDMGEASDAPIVYRLWLEGPRFGHLVPVHAWYEQCDDPSEIRTRLDEVTATLAPVTRATTEAWMLSTRIIQRRALRVAHPEGEQIRKFSLQLNVEPVSGRGPSGRSTVTAFLRPNASLSDVWTLPNGDAIARVTFTGIPSGLGVMKDTGVLLTDVLR